jgi:hypothetical protein
LKNHLLKNLSFFKLFEKELCMNAHKLLYKNQTISHIFSKAPNNLSMHLEADKLYLEMQ